MKSKMIIVIKVGSASLVNDRTFQPNFSAFESIADTICLLRSAGHDVILVSSGAVALGRGVCKTRQNKVSRSLKKALAAVGQAKLMSLWEDAFSRTNQLVAQVLLSKETEMSKTHNQTSSMLHSLLNLGVVPIVNENDALASSAFGGNDVVALLVAQMVEATILTFLTDVDCLYTKNPRIHTDAEAIEVVSDCTQLKVDVSSKGTALGTGGMESKLVSASLASSLGITTILNNVSTTHNIVNVVHNLLLDDLIPTGSTHLGSDNGKCQTSVSGTKLNGTDRWPSTRHTLFLPTKTTGDMYRPMWDEIGLRL